LMSVLLYPSRHTQGEGMQGTLQAAGTDNR
jgi:hypothetical protein